MLEWSYDTPIDPKLYVLEASAGTGKTWNIAHLVTRLILEKHLRMEELLIVTFTRAATAELQERIHARIVQVLQAIDDEVPPEEPALAYLHKHFGPHHAQHAEARNRLELASTEVDLATIATIHSFCQRVVQNHSLLIGTEAGSELEQNVRGLCEELADDYLAQLTLRLDGRQWSSLDALAKLDRSALVALALQRADNAHLPLHPSEGADFQEWYQRIEKLRSASDTLKHLWKNKGKEFSKQFIKEVNNKIYNGRSCTPEKAQAWLNAMDSFAQNPSALRPILEKKKLIPLSSAALTKLLKKGQSSELVEHPFARQLQSFEEMPTPDPNVVLRDFSHWFDEAYERLKTAKKALTFHDLLANVARALDAASPNRDALRETLRATYKAALIDEFQDTDELQWQIFDSVFRSPDHYLFLVGDPKQSIYTFRGADVQVYLSARESAGEDAVFTMRTNWRSSGAFIDAANAMMDHEHTFADPRIRYVKVGAAAANEELLLKGAFSPSEEDVSAIHFSLFEPSTLGLSKSTISGSDLEPMSRHIAQDIVRWLAKAPYIEDKEGRRRPLQARDIAVLCNTNAQCLSVWRALAEVGIASTIEQSQSVFHSVEAGWMSALLDAIDSLRDEAVRRAGLTPLSALPVHAFSLGSDVDSEALGSWFESLARWQNLWRRRGVFHALRVASEELRWVSRFAGHAAGERSLTNIRHLQELLHEAECAGQLTSAALLSWLRDEMETERPPADGQLLRLETDAAALKVMTIHKSKGLEFPVVYLPWAHSSSNRRPENSLVVAGRSGRPRRIELIVQDSPSAEQAKQDSVWAESRDQLRRLYVGVTRARFRAVIYAGAFYQAEQSPLGWMLCPESSTEESPKTPSKKGSLSSVANALHTLGERFSTKAPNISFSAAESMILSAEESAHEPTASEPPTLARAPYPARPLQRTWGQSSYSSITRGAKHLDLQHALVEEAGMADRDPSPQEIEQSASPLAASEVAVPDDIDALSLDSGVSIELPPDNLASFPAGRHAGTFLHEVFEKTDFEEAHSEDAPEGLRLVLERLLPRHGFAFDPWRDALTKDLADVLRAPLGGPLADFQLSQIPRSRRFDELRFDMAIRGGRAWRPSTHTALTPRELTALIAEANPSAFSDSYLDLLRNYDAGPESLAGFMTGSIDLVFKAPEEHGGRWFIADYKSNRLHPRQLRTKLAAHYQQDALAQTMEEHHYGIQYHLYALAFHRLLRQRLGAGYSYDEHFGGALYLFIRGMNKDAPPGQGVVHARPPFEIIDALDHLLDTATEVVC